MPTLLLQYPVSQPPNVGLSKTSSKTTWRAIALVRLPLDFDQVFTNASELSRAYTAKTLTRSLDLVHVAASHLAMCTTFVSADDRQLAIAKATGLKVTDIKNRTRSR